MISYQKQFENPEIEKQKKIRNKNKENFEFQQFAISKATGQ